MQALERGVASGTIGNEEIREAESCADLSKSSIGNAVGAFVGSPDDATLLKMGKASPGLFFYGSLEPAKATEWAIEAPNKDPWSPSTSS
ncbi:hypothetical protein AAE478_001369 [Parahypoxylon ruwenzoriense]